MVLLLDTQVWLWMLADPARLSRKSRALIETAENELLFSAASAWEIAIKWQLGKLTLPEPPEAYMPRIVAETAVTPLPVMQRHAIRVAELPMHHRDPFDRLLIAQAQLEQVPVLTADQHFRRYDVKVIRAGR